MSEQDFQNSGMQPLPARNMTVFPDRRKPTDTEILIGMVERLMERVDALDSKLTRHDAAEPEAIRQAVAAAMHDALPDGDADGHRRAHEAWIRREETKTAFWEKMKVELFKYGLLGFAGWAGYALWRAFLAGPK